jgi:hypothetical protein
MGPSGNVPAPILGDRFPLTFVGISPEVSWEALGLRQDPHL